MYRIKPRQTIYGTRLKSWYRSIDGNLPFNWRERPFIRVKNCELSYTITRIYRGLAKYQR